MSDIWLISGDIDGKELHDEQRRHPRHVRCDFSKDNRKMMDAQEGLSDESQAAHFSIPADRWEAIFRRT